jgi:ribonuclease P protein component
VTEAQGQGLTAAERIRRRAEFERIYSQGFRKHGRYMTVFLLSNETGRSRVGIAATRKIGSAVERNRAKRLAREVFRRHKPAGGHDIVIVPRREMLNAPFSHLEADFQDLLTRPVRPSSDRSAASSPRGAGAVKRL